MQELAEDIWTVDAPLSMFGLQVGTRMTVVRLDGGDLWVHSPIELEPDLQSSVEELGEVAYIVAPNRFHHLFVGEWADAYPDAETWAAPGLPEKRDDLEFDAVLTREPTTWGDAIAAKPIEGTRLLREVVFYHRPSRTLVSADLFFNRHETDSLWTRFYLWVGGALGKPAISSLLALDYRDREAVRASFEELFEWEFERIVVSHGRIVESDARETLRRVVSEEFD